MKFSTTGIDSNACCSESLSFLQRCPYPQVNSRPSRGFSRALHSQLKRGEGGTGHPFWPVKLDRSPLLPQDPPNRGAGRCQDQAFTWHPHLLARSPVQPQESTTSLAPELQSKLTFSLPQGLFPCATPTFLESLFFNIFPRVAFSFPIQSHSSEAGQNLSFQGSSGPVTLVLRILPELTVLRGVIYWKRLRRDKIAPLEFSNTFLDSFFLWTS